MYRYFLALRWLLSRPINLLGLAGVAVGVWAMIVVVSVFSGFLKEVRAHVRDASADLTVISLSPPASYAGLQKAALSDPNVRACAPRLLEPGLLHAYGKSHERLPALNPLEDLGDSPLVMQTGIDPGAESGATGFRSWLTGLDDPRLRVDDLDDPLPVIDGKPSILLSEHRLRREFIAKGAVVKVTTAKAAPLDGSGAELPVLESREYVVSGAYATRHRAFDSLYAFVHIDTLRAAANTRVRDPVSEVVVACHDPRRNEETAARLDRALADVLPPFQPARALSWQQLNERILSTVDHQRSLMKLVMFVIMVVAAFLMYATLSMMVTEKTHDIGVLTAMGATRRGVMQVFLTCGLAIVVCGAAFGAIAGCISSLYLDAVNSWLRAAFDIDLFPTRIYNLERVPYDLDPLWIAQVVVAALVLGLLVSGLPAWRAARHDPLESLRIE